MIATRRIEERLHGLDAASADRALLAAGVDLDDLALSLAVHPTPVIGWTLTSTELEYRTLAGAATLATLLPDVGGLRLAVTTEALPTDVLPRLLRVPAVASAFIPVKRPAGALRRRPWHWPLRVGLVGFRHGRGRPSAPRSARSSRSSRGCVEVARVEDEPGAVDVLVIQGPLADAVESGPRTGSSRTPSSCSTRRSTASPCSRRCWPPRAPPPARSRAPLVPPRDVAACSPRSCSKRRTPRPSTSR